MTTNGTESIKAVAIPVIAFVAPGPEVTRHTPGLPVARAERLEAEDCFTMPAGLRYGLAECSDDLEFLEVSLPAAFETL